MTTKALLKALRPTQPRRSSTMSDVTTATELPEGWPEAYTISGDLIVPGLWVLDYNWRVGMVTDRTPDANNGINDSIVHWFHLTTGYFDGSRMWSRHPSTGRRIIAPDEA